MFEITAERAKEIWLERLEKHNQNWPEWTELQDLVKKTTFQLEDFPYTEELFLVGPAEDNYKLIHKFSGSKYSVCDEDGFITLPEPFPDYLNPLYELKWDNDIMMSGGLGGYAEKKNCQILKTEAGKPLIFNYYNDEKEFDVSSLEAFLMFDKLEEVNYLVIDLYTLQTNRSGSKFLMGEDQNVYTFSPNSAGFELIGSIGDFIRYCLRCILDKQDWYEGYYKKEKFEEYNLKYSDHWLD